MSGGPGRRGKRGPGAGSPAPEQGWPEEPVGPGAPARDPRRRAGASLELRSARGALGFLTVLGRSGTPGDARSGAPDGRALWWFAPVGAGLGAACGIVWSRATLRGGAVLGAALATATDALLSGGLHLDGLADSADGLLAPMARARRLEVMADPAVGAFGATAVGLCLLCRCAALASQRPSPSLVAGVWALSRGCMAVGACTLAYARPGGGLASAFLSRAPAPLPLLATAGAVAGALVLAPPGRRRGIGALGAESIAALGVLALARRRLGGFTGDVLGAAGVLGETAGLVAAALVGGSRAPGRDDRARAGGTGGVLIDAGEAAARRGVARSAARYVPESRRRRHAERRGHGGHRLARGSAAESR